MSKQWSFVKDRKCLFIIVLAPCSPAAGELYLQESAVHFRESIHGRSGWEPTFEIDRRYPLTSALSVCRASAFSASLVHSSNISIPQNWNGSPQRAGTHTSRTAWALLRQPRQGSNGPRTPPQACLAASRHALHAVPLYISPGWQRQGYTDSGGCGHSTEFLKTLGAS